MYSINLNKPEIIKDLKIINIQEIKPHERVITERKNTLKSYLESYKKYIVIPSIICCYKTMIIVDGHHRYQTLLELGAKNIPVTLIDYDSDSLRTHPNKLSRLKKEDIVKAAFQNNLLPPKSTIHEIKTQDGSWKPIILISSLCEFKF